MQIIYFFARVYKTTEFSYLSLSEIIIILWIIYYYQIKNKDYCGIVIISCIGYLVNYLRLDYDLVILFIWENALIPVLLLIISYGFYNFCYVVDMLFMYEFDRIQISLYLYSYSAYIAERNALLPLILIPLHVLLTRMILIINKMLSGKIPEILLPISFYYLATYCIYFIITSLSK